MKTRVITDAHLELMKKIIDANLTREETEELIAFAQDLKEKRPQSTNDELVS